MILGEMTFGLNSFGKQKILSEADTIAQLILNILFMRPGQMPSMPHIGINIRSYLYKFDDDLDVDALKQKISFQCSKIIPFIDTDGMVLTVVNYRGESILMIIIPILVSGGSKNLIMGFRHGDDDDIIFNYQLEATDLTA